MFLVVFGILCHFFVHVFTCKIIKVYVASSLLSPSPVFIFALEKCSSNKQKPSGRGVVCLKVKVTCFGVNFVTVQ